MTPAASSEVEPTNIIDVTPRILAQQEAEEIEEVPTESPEDLRARAQMEVFRTIQILQEAQQNPQDGIVRIIVPADLKDAFLEILNDTEIVPEELLPLEVRSQLPLEVRSDVTNVQAVMFSQLEASFLINYFGPRNQGGNGLIERLQAVINKQGRPVRVTLDYLRNRFLAELEQQNPGILLASQPVMQSNYLR